MNNAIEKPLSDSQRERGIKRKYIPVSVVIDELIKLRDVKMWSVSGQAGGQDQYAGMPPALRIVDGLISKLTNTD